MNGSDIALDTNVAVHVMNGVSATIAFVSTFGKVFLPVPVIGELRYGALNSSRPVENLTKIAELVAGCTAINVEMGTVETYARVRFELKKQGTPIPENDIWIAAICLQGRSPDCNT